MLRRRSRSAPAVLVVLAGLFLAAPVAAQTGPSAKREAAEDALADAQRLAEGEGGRTGRELTTALLEVARQRSALTSTDKAEADRLLARPTDAGDVGVGGPYASSARVLKTCNTDFCVHWVDSSADAPTAANVNNCTASPDFVDHVLAALGQARAVENGQLGWRNPVSDGTRGGDPRTDVYLKDLNPPGVGLYGYASTDGGSGRTRPAYMVLDNDYAASEFPRYLGNYRLPAEVTAAHEYNHVLQYAYDIRQDTWMYESTATWAEEKVFPLDNDYHLYMDTWAGNPGLPLTSPDGDKKYGSAIWNHWLEQRYGAVTVKRAWEESLNSGTATRGLAPKAYDLAIEPTPQGTSFGDDFGDFAAATAAWQGNDSGILEGPDFGVPVERAHAVDNPLVIGNPARFTTVDHTGFKLFDIAVPDTVTDPVKLTVTLRRAAGNGAAGTIALVGIDGAGDVTKVVARTTPTGAETRVTMPGDPNRFERLTAVVANADLRNGGVFDVDADDWNWSRDDEPALLSVTTAPGEGDDPLPPEPLDPDETGAAPDPACGTTTIEREPVVPPDTSTPPVTPSPTVSPTVTPTPTVTPPPVTSVRLSRNTTRLSTVLRTGKLSLFARTNKAGRLSAKATVDAATAKRLKVGRRTTTVGTGRRTATAPSRLKVTVKLTRKLRAAIKRHRKRALKLKLAVALAPVDGTAADRDTITLTLKP